MSELTYGGLIFLLLVTIDLAYYFALWVNRIPKVDGYTIEPFNRHELTMWRYRCSHFDLMVTFNPIKFVDNAIKYSDLAVEVEIQIVDRGLPDRLRLWLDGVKYDLSLVHTEPNKGFYSAIVSQSDKLTKRHNPILETIG